MCISTAEGVLVLSNINLTLPRAREFPFGGIGPVIPPIRRNAWKANKYIAFSNTDVNFDEPVCDKDSINPFRMDGVIGRRESFAFLRLQYPRKVFVTMKCCVKSEYPPNLRKKT